MISKGWLVVGAFVIVAVGVIAFVSLGHSVSGTPAQRLRSWVTSTTLGQHIGTLEDESGAVGKAVDGHKSLTALHTACAAIADDAQTYNDDLPAPDTTVTRLLARAYGLEYDAAESCYRASSLGARLFGVSARDRAAANVLFDKVVQRVRAVAGGTLSTTTTTVPDLTGTALF